MLHSDPTGATIYTLIRFVVSVRPAPCPPPPLPLLSPPGGSAVERVEPNSELAAVTARRGEARRGKTPYPPPSAPTIPSELVEKMLKRR